MECIIMTPLGDTVLDLSVEDISDLRFMAIMKSKAPDPSQEQTTPPMRTGVALPEGVPPVGESRTSQPDTMFDPNETCGKIHAFCARFPGLSHSQCAACGHFTKLDSMRPAYVRCEKCGREFKYRTNIQDTKFTIDCLNCHEPVTLRLGTKGTAFVTPHEERGGTP